MTQIPSASSETVSSVGSIISALKSLKKMEALSLLGGAVIAIGVTALSPIIIKLTKEIADGTYAVKKYNNKMAESEENIKNNESAMDSYNSKIETNKDKIEELQALYDNGTITAAQEVELENLRYKNQLLDQEIEKLKEINKQEIKSAVKAFNSGFGNSDNQANPNAVITETSKSLGGDGTSNGIGYTRLAGDSGSLTDVQQLVRLKLATDAYNQAVANYNAEQTEENKEALEGYRVALDVITEDFESVQDTLYNNLVALIEVLDAVKGTDAFDENAYNDMQAWLDLIKQYAPKYAEAAKKAQEEAAKAVSNTDVIDYSSSFETINEQLTTLTENASLLRDINKEISNSGKISAENLAKINESFPEEKFPEMTKALYEYQLGLISTTELFEELENCYNSDADSYKQLIAKKLELDANFTEQLATNYPDLFEEINNKVYNGDLENWKTLEQTKLDIDNQITEALKQNWLTYLGIVYNAAEGLYELAYRSGYSSSATTNYDDADLIAQYVASGYTDDEAQRLVAAETSKGQAMADSLNDLKKLKEELENATIDFVDLSVGDLGWRSLSSDLSDTSEEMDWLERAIDKVNRAYNRLKNISSDTTRSWATRNAAVSQSMSELTKEIELQTQAYEYYMQLFWALDLDDYYKQLIMDGAMFVETITDPELLELINKAIELFDKAQDAQDSVSSMTAELHELSTEIFDNTAKEFEGILNVYEHAMKTLENGVSLTETKGYKVSASLYEAMISQTQAQISVLEQERSALESAMASADVEYGSEAWMNMYNQILDVDNAIQDATISIAEFENELRQLEWDKFDDIANGIQETIDEADFLYELLSNKTLTDDDGNMNNLGIAAQGLLAEKYNLYMAMADRYANGVKEIDAQLANDPNNTTLLERRQELLKAQRDAILNAEDEKQSIKDLIEDSYNELGNTLSDLIDKYKDFMSTIKDTYDYEKQMAEKTKELADLQKQLGAVRNDDSEEGMSRRQQLSEQIKEKQDDIEQTEYEKLISDTEALLDKFNSDYQEWVTNLVTEVETTLQMAIDQTNQYSDQILATLEDQAYGVGYTLSDTTTAVFSSIGDAVSVYGQGFLDSAVGINNSIQMVVNAVERIYSAVEALTIAQQAIAQAQQMIAAAASGSGSSSGSSGTTSSQSSSSSSSSDSAGVGTVATLKSGSQYWETSWGTGDYGSKYAGVENGVIIDEMSIAGLVDGGQNNPNSHGDKYVHIRSADGQYRDLGWVSWDDLEGYKTGVRKAVVDYAWTQEDGGELIRRADGALLTPTKGATVFNNDQTQVAWDFTKNPSQYISDVLSGSTWGISDLGSSSTSNSNVSMSVGDFNIQVVANNPTDFATQMKNVMASDSNAQKMIQEITLGQALGRNSLNVTKYK